MLSRFSFLLLLTLPLAIQALAATPMTKIRVEVRNSSDKPVERASVIITLDKGRSVVKLGKKDRTHWEMRTNQEGVAKIPSLPQGKLLVQIIAKQKGMQSDEVDQTVTLVDSWVEKNRRDL